MQDTTYIDSEDYVKNPCYNCSHDCPRLCDCEVCDKDTGTTGNLNDLLDMDF